MSNTYTQSVWQINLFLNQTVPNIQSKKYNRYKVRIAVYTELHN